MAKNFEQATAEELEEFRASVVKAILHEEGLYCNDQYKDQYKKLAKILSAMATVSKKNGVTVSYNVDPDGHSDISVSPYEPMEYTTTTKPIKKEAEK